MTSDVLPSNVDVTPAPGRAQIDNDVTPAECVFDATVTPTADTIPALPSIYSTSPAVNHQEGSRSQSALLADLEPHQLDESIISSGDAAQWLQMYSILYLPITQTRETVGFHTICIRS